MGRNENSSNLSPLFTTNSAHKSQSSFCEIFLMTYNFLILLLNLSPSDGRCGERIVVVACMDSTSKTHIQRIPLAFHRYTLLLLYQGMLVPPLSFPSFLSDICQNVSRQSCDREFEYP